MVACAVCLGASGIGEVPTMGTGFSTGAGAGFTTGAGMTAGVGATFAEEPIIGLTKGTVEGVWAGTGAAIGAVAGEGADLAGKAFVFDGWIGFAAGAVIPFISSPLLSVLSFDASCDM
jgi:hypothetical protein